MSVSDVATSKPPRIKPDWVAVRHQYETGNLSQRNLAKHLGISDSTLMRRAMREKWCQNAKLVRQTAAQMEAKVDAKARLLVQDQLAPWIEKQKTAITKRGFKLASHGLSRVEKLFKHNPDPEPKSEAFISKAAETYHRIGRTALGMSDTGTGTGALNLSILTNQALVQVKDQS